uniref:PaaN n=1 Tax=Pseudomonas fluorescens TaxID=294 RepID=Q19A62_PSEFL|nr:PaaN [Pseudomonas fluorescens]
MSHAPTLQSFIGGRWIGQQGAQALRSALDGHTVARPHEETLDFAEAVEYGRRHGIAALMAMDFQQRTARLKALGKYLSERKEQLYAISHHSGATRADSWIDIEGVRAGTLFAYASIGARELPSGNVVHEGPAIPLGKTGKFAGSHILVPRGGLAVHINAFNFPIWGMLEKFAPSFLAGMPCIIKPATATSYITEAAVRLLHESGLLPAGSLQLIIGGTGDLLDRLQGQDVVTFTGSADTAAKLRVNPNLVRNSIPFNAEADSLNCAILAPNVTPDDMEFELFVKEVAREMTVKAGQKCTAIRRAIVPTRYIDAVAERLHARLAKVVVGDPSVEGMKMGALASHAQQADVAARVETLLAGSDLLFRARDGFAPLGEGVAEGAFFTPTLLRALDPHAEGGAHDIEAFGPVITLMAYNDINEPVSLVAHGKGRLLATLVTKAPARSPHKIVPVPWLAHAQDSCPCSPTHSTLSSEFQPQR